MAGKVVNSSFVLLSKFVAGGQESALKTATSHIRKTLCTIVMRTKIYILALIILSSCKVPNDNKTFESKTFKWTNALEIVDTNAKVEYFLWEFLNDKRLISEGKWDSMIVLQQGRWDYYRDRNKEFIIINELSEIFDTFELIDNSSFNEFKFIGLSGDTLHFKQIIENISYEIKELINIKWYSINDSIFNGFDSIKDEPIFIFSEYQFNSDSSYRIKYRNEYKGTWRFNQRNNRILLDSLTNNSDVIKIEKLTNDTLILWRRDCRTTPKEIILIRNNWAQHTI